MIDYTKVTYTQHEAPTGIEHLAELNIGARMTADREGTNQDRIRAELRRILWHHLYGDLMPLLGRYFDNALLCFSDHRVQKDLEAKIRALLQEPR